jgi:hypothetical protein
MNKEQFNVLLPLKIQDLVSLLIDDRNMNFDEALDYLYTSKIYEQLSDESTKIWHLSSHKLLEILEIEKKTGKVELPDFV